MKLLYALSDIPKFLMNSSFICVSIYIASLNVFKFPVNLEIRLYFNFKSELQVNSPYLTASIQTADGATSSKYNYLREY